MNTIIHSLETNLLDYLEEIDEQYFLSDKMVKALSTNPKSGYPRKEQFLNALKNTNVNLIANTITTRSGSRPSDNFLIVAEATTKGYAIAEFGDGVYVNRPYQKRGVVQKGKIQTLKTSLDVGVVIAAEQRTDEGLRTFVNNNMGTLRTTDSGGDKRIIENNLRIRKITPKECFRLMGVKDEDYQRIAANQSNSSLYHLAGDSIVVNVLMAIFKQLL